MRLTRVSSLALVILLQGAVARGQEGLWFRITDDPGWESVVDQADSEDEDWLSVHPTSFQPMPPPQIQFARPADTPAPAAARELSESLFGGSLIGPSLIERDRRSYPVGIASDWIGGPEARGRGTTDGGDLIAKSHRALSAASQHRNPIITDTRIRSSRIGRQPGSGSYWVPARIDLDTTLSKIDSRLLRDVLTISGPYAVGYGPGFSHVDFQLWDAPRFEDGPQLHGSTSFDYKTNGQQWYGRQMLWGGAADWGFRAGYGHRTGNDYTTGGGLQIPSSYNSRDVDLALGKDLSCDSRIEFHGLRLDQTNVELPGQAFDIDWLKTDGYEAKYVLEDQPAFDRLDINVWYNRTRLDGSAQRPGKRQQFPFYEFLDFIGNTDVRSVSTGYSAVAAWGDADDAQLRIGTDLRYLRQQLNEITSSDEFDWADANSPIPDSDLVNPGLFVDCRLAVGERWTLGAGARVDYAGATVLEDLANLQSLTPAELPLDSILGTDRFEQHFFLWAAFLTSEYEINACWTADAAVGYAERPPSLTELYAAQPFMFVLQNGLNTVTGDPRLARERLGQIDLGLRYDNGYTRGRIGGFHAWAWDYITFENTGTVPGPPAGQIEQVQLRYVNTALATFMGAEAYGECDVTDWLTPFATLSYVRGQDETRNGDFATRRATAVSPSERVDGLPRGYFNGLPSPGEAKEPLPSIYPLVSRVGVRLHPTEDASRWSVELAARMVARQTRVAASLLESPTPGFTVWDVRGYWRPRPNLLLIAGIENFTDRQYREHLDFRSPNGIQVFQPGINFYTGCELSY
ncbi:MAG: TonB-dependent receptor [Planctomycetaceae bacterium]|nr:MAG: TonB-dependent receptor [Planctomycetaceae bacterium]